MEKMILIAPTVFGFYRHIAEAAKKMQYELVFLDEHVSFFGGVLNRILFKMPTSFLIFIHGIRLYLFLSLLDDRKSINKLLLIRGEFYSSFFLKAIRRKLPNAKLYMYQWDFKRNLPLLHEQIDHFDVVYTFDIEDAKDLGLKHKPLFFNDFHRERASSLTKEKYLISFVGTHHSDRYRFVKLFLKVNPHLVDSVFVHLYRSKSSFHYNRIFNHKALDGLSYCDLNYKVMSEVDTLNILSASRCVLDIHQPGQNGLTIRTFEAVGMRKKLITTNPNIKNYDFYNPSNILIIDREDPFVPRSFLDKPFEPLAEEIYEKYSVHSWLKEILI